MSGDTFTNADDWLGRTQPADLFTMGHTQLADLVREGRKHLLLMACAVGAVEGALLNAAHPTHVVLWACGHHETQRCDPGCQHSDEPTPSMLRCGDCAREA